MGQKYIARLKFRDIAPFQCRTAILYSPCELSTVVKIAPDLCVLFSKATVEIKDITSNTKRLIYIEQIQMHYLKQHIQTVLKTLPVYKKKTVQY